MLIINETHIFIVVTLGSEGHFEFHVGPRRSQRPVNIIRFELGELSLQELVAGYYFDIGFSSSDVAQTLSADNRNNLSALLPIRPEEEMYLYFLGVGVSQNELERLLSGLDFTETDLNKVKGGKWPYRSGIVHLSVEITVQQLEKQVQVNISRFLEFDTSQYQKGEMIICVQYGLTRIASNYRKVGVVSLFWKPPFLPLDMKRTLEPEVYRQIRTQFETDRLLTTQINMLIRTLPDLSPESGDSWHLADWWITGG